MSNIIFKINSTLLRADEVSEDGFILSNDNYKNTLKEMNNSSFTEEKIISHIFDDYCNKWERLIDNY